MTDQKAKRIAVIDLGTNTFHLMIVDQVPDGFKVVYKEKIPVKIAAEGIDKRIITDKGIERALKAITHYKQKIDAYKASIVTATATSAFRNSKNGEEVKHLIYEKTGIYIQVIPGEVEAELIYEGVAQAYPFDKEMSLIMDIGGGSVEFIICNNQGPVWKGSFEVGGQRLMSKFHQEEPIARDKIEALHTYLHEALADLKAAVNMYRPTKLIGSSGTFDSLCEISYRRRGQSFILDQQTFYELDYKDFFAIKDEMVSKNREERAKTPGMIEMRVNLIVVSCLLIENVLHQTGIEKIASSTYALKEGLIKRVLQQIPVLK